jgi:hypothetical protein
MTEINQKTEGLRTELYETQKDLEVTKAFLNTQRNDFMETIRDTKEYLLYSEGVIKKIIINLQLKARCEKRMRTWSLASLSQRAEGTLEGFRPSVPCGAHSSRNEGEGLQPCSTDPQGPRKNSQ